MKTNSRSTTARAPSFTLPQWSAPPEAPFCTTLEHLEALIGRTADLVTAHAARVPEERRFRDGDRMDYLLQATSFASGAVPEFTTALWDIADRKLQWIRQREAVTQIDLPFRRLASSFGLSQVEQDVLMLVAAPKVDPRYQQHFEQIDHEIVDPTVRTAIGLLSRTFEDSVSMRRIFSLDANLLAHSLLLAEVHGNGEGDFLNVGLEVPRRVIGEMLGESHVSEELIALSRLRVAKVPLDQVVLPNEVKETVVSLVRNHSEFVLKRKQWGLDDVISYGRALVMLFSGPPGTGKTMLAHAVAASMGKRLFCIDLPKLVETRGSFESNLDAVFREARLLDAVLFFDECEQIFLSRRKGNDAMPVLLTRLEQYDGVAILATNMEEALDEALARRIVVKIDFQAPTPRARADIWRKHLPQSLPLAADVDIDRLAEGFELTGGYIKNAVLTAVVRCVSRGDDHVRMADLEHGARLQVRVTPDEEQRIHRPEAQLADIVLPSELRERIGQFVSAARARTTVLAEWGLGRTLGSVSALTALFSGPSGTGKSMTAEAIASALDRPIIRCTLAAVISKWVGDTAKNVESLFRSAREHRAVLVFDEADALFAHRVSVKTANDRFAKAETSALLTQIERHEGVVILTTNLVEELDPAFERRLQLRLTFPFPDARARASLWKRMLGSEAPLSADVNLAALGRCYDLSGGLIRNAVLAAALEAATKPAGTRIITQAMLERAACEQLGRPVSLVTVNDIGCA